ncbi:hypothetical protein [Actimicrobium antarcticum]|uniref:Uncharacterized protein n=1 Tax=Actimicrobium antarcticum TaxID=1051899 RepID=A0ABP7TDR8_9BURK
MARYNSIETLESIFREKLEDTRDDYRNGCGGCALAEWIGIDTFEPNSKIGSVNSVIILVGTCRAGIRLSTGSAGYIPIKFCTAKNKPPQAIKRLENDNQNGTEAKQHKLTLSEIRNRNF